MDTNTKPIEIQPSTFEEAMAISRKHSEGIVMLGAGGDLNEWVVGVSKSIHEFGAAPTSDPSSLWESAHRLTTTGGRTDLLLVLKKDSNLDIGKLAMWRLRFGDCSWLSDYVVNYADHHKRK